MVLTLFKIYAWRDFDPVYPKSAPIAHKERKTVRNLDYIIDSG